MKPILMALNLKLAGTCLLCGQESEELLCSVCQRIKEAAYEDLGLLPPKSSPEWGSPLVS